MFSLVTIYMFSLVTILGGSILVDTAKEHLLTVEFQQFKDRRKFCVIDEPRQYENLRLSQE